MTRLISDIASLWTAAANDLEKTFSLIMAGLIVALIIATFIANWLMNKKLEAGGKKCKDDY